MSPAEQLRAAASMLRCDHTFAVFSAANVRPTCQRCGIPFKRREAVAPNIAEPLAAVLEHDADLYDWLISPTCGANAAQADEMMRGSVAVARAILGEAP